MSTVHVSIREDTPFDATYDEGMAHVWVYENGTKRETLRLPITEALSLKARLEAEHEAA